jgi:hypothetical protein
MVFMACTFLLAGSTKYVSTFQSPLAVPGDFSGKKVACFAIIPNEELRSAREETVAIEMRARGVDAIAGSVILPAELEKDRGRAKEFLKKAKIDAVIIVRLLGDQEAVKYSTMASVWYSQPYYGSFAGYWNYGWASASFYETTWTERVVTLETVIFSLEKDQLLWAGTSETTSPKDIKKLVSDLAKATGKELKKAGLVPK